MTCAYLMSERDILNMKSKPSALTKKGSSPKRIIITSYWYF